MYHVKQYSYRSPLTWKIVHPCGTSLCVVKYMHKSSMFYFPTEGSQSIKKLEI